MKKGLRGIRISGMLLLCMLIFCAPGLAAEDTALKGRSILFFGDSLTTGYGLASRQESWCSLLETVYGMEVTNASVSGSTVSAGRTLYQGQWYAGYAPMSRRRIPTGEFDIIFVESGGNDWYYGLPPGTLQDRGDSTFCGGLRTTLARLRQAHPESTIVYMPPWEDDCRPNHLGYLLGHYTMAAASICDEMGVLWFPAFDAWISGIHTNDPFFRQVFCLDEHDRWHLNARGQLLFLPVIAGWLRSAVYGEDPTDDPLGARLLPPGLIAITRGREAWEPTKF